MTVHTSSTQRKQAQPFVSIFEALSASLVVAAALDTRSVAGAAAQPSKLPHGNHGEIIPEIEV